MIPEHFELEIIVKTLKTNLAIFSQKAREVLASHEIIVDECTFSFSDSTIAEAKSGCWGGCVVELRDKLELLLQHTLSDAHCFERDPYVRKIALPDDQAINVAIINQQSKEWYGTEHTIGSFDFVLEAQRGVFENCNTFLDLGGHQLVWSTYYALTSHRAIVKSFEPSILNAIIGLFNCLTNGVIDRVDVFPFAVSTFTPSLEKNHSDKMLVDFIMLPLRTCRLDQFITESFDFIKIDIEGYEFELLSDEQFVKLIKNSKSSHFELHLGHLSKRGVLVEDCVSALQKANLRGIELYSKSDMYDFLRSCDRNGFYSFLIGWESTPTVSFGSI